MIRLCLLAFALFSPLSADYGYNNYGYGCNTCAPVVPVVAVAPVCSTCANHHKHKGKNSAAKKNANPLYADGFDFTQFLGPLGIAAGNGINISAICPNTTNVTTTSPSNETAPPANPGPTKDCPCGAKNYDVTCGSDGVTYSNPCRQACFAPASQPGTKGTSCNNKVTTSPPFADNPCQTTTTLTPTCGKDGFYYESPCLANVIAGGLAASDAVCQTQSCKDGTTTTCPTTANYVCDTNGVSHLNLCLLQCYGNTFAYNGLCTTSKNDYCNSCPTLATSPVCALSGQTYDNDCFACCALDAPISQGPCSNSTNGTASCICQDLYLPVCSQDGNTFKNECLMNCAREKRDYYGTCGRGGDDKCRYQCRSLSLTPVCYNGITYSNPCMIDCLGVKRRYNHGPCGIIQGGPNCGCGMTAALSVCGDNGSTFASPCAASCNNVAIRYQGACGYDGFVDPFANRYDFGCSSACKDRFFGHRKGLNVPYVIVPNLNQFNPYNPLNWYTNHLGCGGNNCCSNNCGGAIYQLPGLGFTPANPFAQIGFSQNYFSAVPGVSALTNLIYPGVNPAVASNPNQFAPQTGTPTPPITVYVQAPAQATQQAQAAPQTFVQAPAAQATKASSTSTTNFGANMSQLSIDFSTATSFDSIPQNLKVQFQKAPYLYYMYFYSLIYYKYATPETKVQGIMVKDLLLYIAQSLLNIVPKFGASQSGQTLTAGQGSPQNAQFNIQATQTSSQTQIGFPVGSGMR